MHAPNASELTTATKRVRKVESPADRERRLIDQALRRELAKRRALQPPPGFRPGAQTCPPLRRRPVGQVSARREARPVRRRRKAAGCRGQRRSPSGGDPSPAGRPFCVRGVA